MNNQNLPFGLANKSRMKALLSVTLFIAFFFAGSVFAQQSVQKIQTKPAMTDNMVIVQQGGMLEISVQATTPGSKYRIQRTYPQDNAYLEVASTGGLLKVPAFKVNAAGKQVITISEIGNGTFAQSFTLDAKAGLGMKAGGQSLFEENTGGLMYAPMNGEVIYIDPDLDLVSNSATICSGGSLTVHLGDAVNGHYYRFQQTFPNTTAPQTILAVGGVVNFSPVYPVSNGATWTVTDTDPLGTFGYSFTVNIVAQPIAPTMTKSPNLAEVCSGTDVSATILTAGSGGVAACEDSYQYRTNEGSWIAYTPGVAISTTGLNSVDIKAKRSDATGAGCSAENIYSWTVNALPVPIVSGSTTVCPNSTGNLYETASGMSNYNWTVTGGSITSGGITTDNTVTVTWGPTGTGLVKVSYTDGNGCTAAAQTDYPVTIDFPVYIGTTGHLTLQDAINDANTGDVIELICNHSEGLVTINKSVEIDGNGNTLTSTSSTWGIALEAININLHDITLTGAGTFGIQQGCDANNLVMTNVTVTGCGGTGISIYGSDGAVLTNITATGNTGNGLNITNCNNTTINGITTSGNAFGGGFSAGIGLFTSHTYCLPAGINGVTLSGTISIAEPTKVYSEKANAADVITGLDLDVYDWAVGVGPLSRFYWPDKVTSYAVVKTLFEAPYNYPNPSIYVAEIATEHYYVDDAPNGSAIPMLINAAITYQASGGTIHVEAGTYAENVIITKPISLLGANANVAFPLANRGAESIIQDAAGGGNPISLSGFGVSDNVTINGFEITGVLANSGIYCGVDGASNLNIKFNYIHDIGTNRGSNNVYAINYRVNEPSPTDVNISDNYITQVLNTGTGATGHSAAIWVGQSTANGTVSNLSIQRNIISHIMSGQSNRNADGISIQAAWGAGTGGVNGAIIKDNTISDITGGIAYGITLSGKAPGIQVTNNILYNIIGLPANPANAVGIIVPSTNIGSATVIINNNSITGVPNAIFNGTGNTIAATCNWYGSAVGNVIATTISGLVTYSPYLISAGTNNNPGFTPDASSCLGEPAAINSATPTDAICGTPGSIALTFSGGSPDYTIDWGGTPVTVTNANPYTITGLVAGSYTVTVTDNYGSSASFGPVSIQYLPVINTNTSVRYATIQEAVNAASTGNIIQLCAGNYTETVNVNNDLTIQGPNAGIDPNGVTLRVPEAVILDGKIDILGSNTVVIDGIKVRQTNDVNPISLGGATVATIQNMIIERFGVNTGAFVRGIETSAGAGMKNIKNNLFTGDVSGGFFSGHKTWNSGMYINGAGSTLNIQDNVFINCRTALNLDDYNANIALTGNTFDNNGTHISFGGTSPTTGSYTLGSNNFKATLSALINLSNVDPSFRLDITASTFNGTAFSALDLNALFGIEAGMYHRNRPGRNGLVYYVANNLYVRSDLNSDINTAVGYAAAGDVINLMDGTFNQRVALNKSVILDGQSETTTILDGTGLGNGRGISISNGITDVTIQDLTVQNFAGVNGNTDGGIYAIGGNDNLTVQHVTLKDNRGASTSGSGFYANGPINNVKLDYVTSTGHFPGARGIVIWNGLKSNITITNCTVFNNNCCGIELQDGDATGVLMQNNTVYNNGDNGIGIVGLTGPGENLIKGNDLDNNGRFGIEIKNPNGTGLTTGAGSIVVEDNNVSMTSSISDLRDMVGIAAFRRGVLTGNVDIPTGVVIQNNSVSGYEQPSTSDGFGIVVEGTNHTVSGNTLTGNDVGIQQQAGHLPYPADGDQSNLADQYFGRGNSPYTCSNTIGTNTFVSNLTNYRDVPSTLLSGGTVTNSNTSKNFCSIQQAIDDATTDDGHTLLVAAGTYYENVLVSKRLTIQGAGPNLTIVQGSTNGADVIRITEGGTDAANRTVIKDLQVTSAGSNNNGIKIDASGSNALGYITIENVHGLNMPGNSAGIRLHGASVATDIITDVKLIDVNFALNYFGVYSKNAQVHGFTVDGVAGRSKFEDNRHSGILFEGDGALAAQFQNFVIHKTDLSRNNSNGDTDMGHGEMFLLGFNGNLDVDDVVVTTGLPTYKATPWYVAMAVNGKYTGGAAPAGIMSFKNIAFNNAPGATHFSRASLGIWTYSNLDAGVTVDGCQFNATGVNMGGLYLFSVAGNTPLVVKNNTFGGNSVYNAVPTDICLLSSLVNVTATENNIFTGAADNFAIEDRIYHAMDLVTLGLVTWIPSNVYVTTNTLGIQQGINVVPNSTVNVGPGTFNQTVTLNKSVNLIGSGCGQTIWKGTAITGRSLNIVRNNTTPANIHVGITGFAFETENNQSIRGDWSAGYTEALTLDIHDNCFKHVNTRNPGTDFALYVDGANQTARGAQGAIRVYNNLFDVVTGGVLFEYCRAVDVLDNTFNVTYEGVTFNYYGTSGNIGDQLVNSNTFNRIGSDFAFAMNNWHGSGTYTVLPTLFENNMITATGFSYAISYGVQASQLQPLSIAIHNNALMSGTIMTWGDFVNQASLDATCNWWGTSSASLIAPKVSNNVQFLPFLVVDNDYGVVDPWWSTDNYSCIGVGPVVVYNQDPSLTGTVIVSSHMTIQAAIDASTTLPGHYIAVSSGNYNELVNVHKGVTISGHGANNTLLEKLSPATDANFITISASNVAIKDIAISGPTGGSTTRGIFIDGTLSNVSLVNVISQQHLYGVHVNAGSEISNLSLTNTVLNINGNGLQIDAEAKVDGLTITDGEMNGNLFGFSTAANSGYDNSNDLNNVTITGTSFQNNGWFGLLFNKGKNVILDGLTVSNNGTAGSPGAGVYFTWREGTYSGITIRNSTITNNGNNAGAANGGGILIRPRANATASGITIENNLISGNGFVGNGSAGIRVLRNNDNAGTNPGILINGNSITGNANFGITSTTDTDINATCNWWGIATGNTIAAMVSGNVDYDPWLVPDASGSSYPWSVTDQYSCGGTPVVIASAVPTHIYCGEATGSIIVTWDGGSANYNLTWTGGGSASNIPASHYTINGLAAGSYTITITDANGSSDIMVAEVLYLPVTKTTLPSTVTYHTTIQAAIDAATAGDVIEVCAGTYVEQIVVNKALTINGPNKDISPNVGTRSPEAILMPAATNVNQIIVQASNVTINGFTIEGDNPLISSGNPGTNNADLDGRSGIYQFADNINNLVIKNNIVQNQTYFGIFLYGGSGSAPATTGNLIQDNLIRDLGHYTGPNNPLWGGGILIYNNQYTRITNNVMQNVRLGIQTGNFSRANTGTVDYQYIGENTISARRTGLFYNLHYGPASPFTLNANTITGVENTSETKWRGILIGSQANAPSNITGNIINGSALVTPTTSGVEVWNVSSMAYSSISGGSVSNVDIGVFANNYEGYNSNGTDGAHAVVSGVTITPKTGGVGVKALDSPSYNGTNPALVSVEVKNNCSISGAATGILAEGADASVTVTNNLATITGNEIGILVKDGADLASVTGNTITNNTHYGIFIDGTAGDIGLINNNNISGNGYTNNVITGIGMYNGKTTAVDAQNNWWGHASGPYNNPYNTCGTGNAVIGLVDFMPWWTTETGGASADMLVYNVDKDAYYCTIQDAIDDADANNTIQVSPGTYNEALLLTKQNLTLESTGGRDATIIDVPFGTLTTGVKVNQGLGTVTFDGFTVKNFTESGIVQPMSQATGTAFHVLNSKVIPYDNYLRNGIQVSGDGSKIIGNAIVGAPLTADWSGSGIHVVNASNVEVKNNTVNTGMSDVGIAITNWSATLVNNITVENNNVFGAQWGGILISGQNNTKEISDVLIKNNVLQNSAQGDGIGIQTVALENLTVQNNELSGNAWAGVWINDDVVLSGYILINSNKIFGNANFGIENATTFMVNATNNWWGDASGPYNNPYNTCGIGNAVSANVNFNPWWTTDTGIDGSGTLAIHNITKDTYYCRIQAAIDDAVDGNVIEVAAGTYTYASEGSPLPSGLIKVTKGVTLQGASGSRPIIDGSGFDGVFKIHPSALLPGNTVKIAGFEIIGNVATGIAMTMQGCFDVTPAAVIIEDNWFHGMIGGINFWGAGAYLPDEWTSGLANIEIKDNKFYDMEDYGPYPGFGVLLEGPVNWSTAGDDYAVKVTENEFSNLPTGSSDPGFGIAIMTGTASYEAANVFVSGNSFTDDVPVGVAFQGGDVSTALVESNSFDNNPAYAILATGIDNGPLTATCNWYGTNTVAGVAAKISGPVNYSPWLIIGTDNSPDIGFQPIPGACAGLTDIYVNDAFTTGDGYTTATGDDATGNGTASAPYATITKAVSVAMVGANIYVDAGTYQEQVQIGKSLNIIGLDRSLTSVVAPATLTSVTWNTAHPVIYAYGNTNTVNISNITIDGNSGRSVSWFVGALYYDANGTFTNNRITGIHDAGTFSGAQMGHAFYATQAGSLTQTVSVTDNLIEDYQKGGIYVRSAGTTATITGNTVTGQNVALVTAQNGICVMLGATGIISGNTVSNNIWNKVEHPHAWTASGILLYQAGISTVENNILTGNELALSSSGSVGVIYGVNNFTDNKIHLWLDAAPDVNAGNVYDKTVLNPAMPEAVFGCIQYAIDEATAGNILNASGGAFAEQVFIHTPVDLRGSNYEINPISGSRVLPEAIITFPTGLTGSQELISIGQYDSRVDVDDVKINGFIIDGNTIATTANTTGIMGYGDGLVVKNNIIRNFNYVSLWVSSYVFEGGNWLYDDYINSAIIGNNYIHNADIYSNLQPIDVPYGIYLQGTYGLITGNKIETVKSGIQVQPYNHPNTTSLIGMVSNNSFEAYRDAMWYNYSDNANANWVFEGNTGTGIASPPGNPESSWHGFRTTTNRNGELSFTNNVLTPGATNSPDTYGVLFVQPSAATVVVSVEDNTISGFDYGVNIPVGLAYVSSIDIENNKIADNSIYGVFNGTSSTLNATQNWWGDASGPYKALGNTCGLGNDVTDNVTICSWFTDAAMTNLDGCETNTSYAVTGGGSYCYGGTGVIVGLNESEVGVEYQLYVDNVQEGTSVAGTGEAISFGSQTLAGTYTVKGTKTVTGCTLDMTGSVEVSINALPTATISITGNPSICSGGSSVLTVDLTGTEPWTYLWSDDGGATTHEVIASTSSSTFTVSPTSNTTYTIVSVTDANGCTNVGTGDVRIYVGPITTVTSIEDACVGSNIAIPVRVKSFAEVGSITLTLTYGPELTYVSSTEGEGLMSNFSVSKDPVSNTLYVVGYLQNASDLPITLSDNAILFTPTFTYHGGTATLAFFDPLSNPSDCEYSFGDWPDFSPFCDTPTGTYYINGTITEDDNNPTIATLGPISVFADADACTYASLQLTAPDADDNCSVASVVASPATLVLGANTVTWTVTDGSGNTATSDQTVTVVDDQEPTISCPTPANPYTVNNGCTWTGVGLGATINDNCGTPTLSYSLDGGITYTIGDLNGYPFPIETTNVIYKATDASGNETICSFSITVQGYTISGNLKYNNPSHTPMSNVTITLLQGLVNFGSDITDVNGDYTITNVCDGDYDLIFSTSKPTGGINSTDAATVNAWGVLAAGTSAYDIEMVRFFAGDVIGSNSVINSNDAGRILNYFVTGGNPNPPFTSVWSFWNTTDMINDNPGPSSKVVTISVPNGSAPNIHNYYAQVTGDFNRSFTPGSAKAMMENVMLNIGGATLVEPGVAFELPVTAAMNMEIGAISLIFDFPTDQLEVSSVYLSNDPDSPMEFAVIGNELRVGWNALIPMYLNTGETLLTLNLRTISTLAQGETIRLSLTSDPLNELADGNYNIIPNAQLFVDEIGGTVTSIPEVVMNGNLMLESYPNPYVDKVTFAYSLPKEGRVVLELANMLGSTNVILLDEWQSAGDHTFTADLSRFNVGVYTATIRLHNKRDVISRAIKVIRRQ